MKNYIYKNVLILKYNICLLFRNITYYKIIKILKVLTFYNEIK